MGRGRQRGMLSKPHIDTKRLVAMYRSGMTTYEIASAVGMTQGGVYNRIARMAREPMRSKSDYHPSIPLPQLIALYESGQSAEAVAPIAGISSGGVRYKLRNAGIKLRTNGDYNGLSGSRNPAWKGGRAIYADGYVSVAVIGEKRRVPEHRLIMERELGRPLGKDEIVHHLNGVRHDNRIDNLTITTRKDHEHYTYIKALQKRIRELESHSVNLKG